MNLHGYVDIVQEIINKGVNVNVKDDNSFFFFFFFFLHLACGDNHMESFCTMHGNQFLLHFFCYIYH